MSEDRPPYGPPDQAERISDFDRVRKALMVYKNWIWSDGIEIAKLRTRMKKLEGELADLKGYVERLLLKTDN